ncbi:MAG: TetR/AcrR family transcriptional regulator [Lachnospiraceae bacterium]
MSKTKHAIQRAYFTLLKENSDKKITISEITRRANIDRKTFYLHYTSTEDIIREFSKNKVDELIKRVVAEGFPEELYVERVFAVFNEMICENMDVLRMLSGSGAYEYFFAQIKGLLVQRLLEAAEKKEGFTPVQIRVVAEYFISGIVSAYVRWIREEMPCSIEELADYISMVTVGGFRAVMEQEAGRK